MRQPRRQSEMQRQTDAFRNRVLALEGMATGQLSTAYADVLSQLEPRIEALSLQIAEAIANGQQPGVCHCMPPQVAMIVVPQGLVVQTQFPQPHSAMWCAAWQMRQTPIAEGPETEQ